jgi:hypothetical protein
MATTWAGTARVWAVATVDLGPGISARDAARGARRATLRQATRGRGRTHVGCLALAMACGLIVAGGASSGLAQSVAATFDPGFATPRCAGFASECDSGTLLVGRGPAGPEPNAPNTTAGTCQDGQADEDLFHLATPSMDRLRVFRSGGGALTLGEPVQIEATLFAGYNAYAYLEVLDIFETDDTSIMPLVWRHIGSAMPYEPGFHTYTFSYTPTGTALNRAVRAAYRTGGYSSTLPCGSVIVDDHDDLWFRVDSAAGTHGLVIDGTVEGSGSPSVSAEVVGGASLGSCSFSADPGPYGGGCEFAVEENLEVLLTPEPGSSASFVGWGGACSGTDPCTVTMSEARRVLAAFGPPPPPPEYVNLHITLSNDASGSVAVEPLGTICTVSSPGGDCTYQVEVGTELQLTAQPGSGSIFLGWSSPWDPSACGASPTCSFTVESHISPVYNPEATFQGVADVTLSRPEPHSVLKESELGACDVEGTAHGDAGVESVSALVVGTHSAPGDWVPLQATGDRYCGTLAGLPLEPGLQFVSLQGYDGVSWREDDESFVMQIPGGVRAAYDPAVGAPTCGPGTSCDSGSLLAGRGAMGPEPGAPNTIGSSCPDGDDVGRRLSVDQVVVRSSDGNMLVPGATVVAEATIRDPDASEVAFFYAPDASSPQWTEVGRQSVYPMTEGMGIESATFTLAEGGPTQAIRVVVGPSGSSGPCPIGGEIDHDDLVFSVVALQPATVAGPHWVPTCGPGASCDSGTLLVGRGAVGPEANAPNTIEPGCADGDEGELHVAPSLDRLSVWTLEGTSLAAGSEAEVAATVWSQSGDEALDVYYASTLWEPDWRLIATLHPEGTGEQTLTTSIRLELGGTLQAVRGVWRSGNVPHPDDPACTAGSLDDHDDLVFTVGRSMPGVAAYDPALGAPRCQAVGACDSRGLLSGRAEVGPEEHQPNTIASSCADSTGESGGVSPSAPSIDRIRVFGQGGGIPAEGQPIEIEVTVIASEDFANESLVVRFGRGGPQGGIDDWPYGALAGSVSPSQAGRQVLGLSFVPPEMGPGGSHDLWIRAAYRREAVVDACMEGVPGDHDDLAFRMAAPEGAHVLAVDGVLDGKYGPSYADVWWDPSGTCSLDRDPSSPNLGCSLSYPDGQEVTFEPPSGQLDEFYGWTGDCSGKEPCTITMNADHHVGAEFGPGPETVEVWWDDKTPVGQPPGTGTIQVDPQGELCTDSCSYDVPVGTRMTLTAIPTGDSTFLKWDDQYADKHCAGSTNPVCTFVVRPTETHDSWAVADFVGPAVVEVELDGVGEGSGSVHIEPSGQSCVVQPSSHTTCSFQYKRGTTVTVTGVPEPRASAYWMSPNLGWQSAGTYTVALDPGAAVHVQFVQLYLAVTLDSKDGGSGRVEIAPLGQACSMQESPCAFPVEIGNLLTLTGVPDVGSTFRWSGGRCFGTGVCDIEVDSDAILSAEALFTGGGTLQIQDGGVTEGDDGTKTITFTVTLSQSP